MSSGFSGLQNNIARNLLCGPGSGGDGWRGGSHPPLVSFKRPSLSIFFCCEKPQNHSLSILRSLVASRFWQTHATLPSESAQGLDDLLRKEPNGFSLSNNQQQQGKQRHTPLNSLSPLLGSPGRCFSTGSHVERAWAHWNKLGKPKLIIAPMFDNSELPFRLLCRRYGAEAGYTPMLHARIFSESEKYRSEEFTTCKEDRPLFVQFCANDPDILFEAAQRVEPYCDYVDINLGCPQNIARRGNYGAFLMDNLPLVKALVQKLALNLNVPVSCKIRVFPNLQDTINYAKMLEEAGCSLLAVHGRTRDEKDGKKFRADWDAIKAVKAALKIPVLGNGNIRHMGDVLDCLEKTNVDGVLSAESLLENPALFAGFCTAAWVEGSDQKYKDGNLDQADLIIEYLKLCEEYPVPWRMIQSHVYKILGEWFKIHPHIREDLNKQSKLTFEFLYDMVNRLKVMDGRIPLYVKDDQVRRTSATW